MKKKEPTKIIRSPRAQNRSIDAYKMLLRVDLDWGSEGIWGIDEPGGQLKGYVRYEKLNVSPELRKRFDFWTEWYAWGVPWSWQQQADSELHRAYGWSLAIDLKRELGDDYYVEYGGREIHDDHAFMQKLKDSR